MEMTKQKIANYAFTGATVLIGVLIVAGGIIGRGESPLGKTDTAQANYNELMTALCERGLKPLATAKIDDKRAGLLDGDIDLNELVQKESMDCSKAYVEWVF